MYVQPILTNRFRIKEKVIDQAQIISITIFIVPSRFIKIIFYLLGYTMVWNG